MRTLAVPIAGLLPGLVAATNLAIVAELSSGSTPRSSTTVVVVMVGLNLAFLGYCRYTLQRLGTARLEPPRRWSVRIAATVGYSVTNAVLLVAVAVGGYLLLTGIVPSIQPLTLPAVPRYVALDRSYAWLPGPARAASLGVVLIALGPVLAVTAGWVLHVCGHLVVLPITTWRAQPLSSPDRRVDVRVGDLGAPVVRPVRPPCGRPTILFDHRVCEALSRKEREAVIAHETHHLETRTREEGLAAALAAVLLGGRNVLLSFLDLRAAEARADDVAAERVGRDPLIGAIRTLEALRTDAIVSELSTAVTEAEASGSRLPSWGRVRRLLSAPAELYFGDVLLEGAHSSADERVRRLIGENESPPQIGQSDRSPA